MIFVNERPKVGIQTFHSIFIENIRKSYKRFLKQRSKAFEARRRRAGGGAGGLVSPGGG